MLSRKWIAGAGGFFALAPLMRAAVDVLEFNDPAAGKAGPIAWQMHNAGLFDEFTDVRIEEL